MSAGRIATNVGPGTRILSYPPCPKCKGTTIVAPYDERRSVQYASEGITVDGIVAEDESWAQQGDESDFTPLVRKSDGARLVQCDDCNSFLRPTIANGPDNPEVFLDLIADAETKWEADK